VMWIIFQCDPVGMNKNEDWQQIVNQLL
jgi:hypothetical protein